MLVQARWCDELCEAIEQFEGRHDKFGVAIHGGLAQVIHQCRVVELLETITAQRWTCAVAHQTLESLAIPRGDQH